MDLLPRIRERNTLEHRIANSPVTAILGPRQCGKTTLASMLGSDHSFDLENPRDAARLEHAQTVVEQLRGLVVIDEVQRAPSLFPLLRYLSDTQPETRFLLLGSASPDLVRDTSESLAGRIAYQDLGPLAVDEIGSIPWQRLWQRGGFPRSLLHRDDAASFRWREDFVRSFLERDIPQLGLSVPAATLRRFWIMISHYHGGLLNFSELGRSLGVSDHTIRRYLEILEGTFMVRLLPPWHANVGKRLVKAPKLYIRDSGLFHLLQSIGTQKDLSAHPKLGASWEGFALEQALRLVPIDARFFWRTHGGAELDLLWHAGGRSWGMEFKYADAPTVTRSMRSVLNDLNLEHLWVVYPGDETYALSDKVTVIPITALADVRDAVG